MDRVEYAGSIEGSKFRSKTLQKQEDEDDDDLAARRAGKVGVGRWEVGCGPLTSGFDPSSASQFIILPNIQHLETNPILSSQ